MFHQRSTGRSVARFSAEDDVKKKGIKDKSVRFDAFKQSTAVYTLEIRCVLCSVAKGTLNALGVLTRVSFSPSWVFMRAKVVVIGVRYVFL